MQLLGSQDLKSRSTGLGSVLHFPCLLHLRPEYKPLPSPSTFPLFLLISSNHYEDQSKARAGEERKEDLVVFRILPSENRSGASVRTLHPASLPTAPNRVYKTSSIVSNACDSLAQSSLTLHGVQSPSCFIRLKLALTHSQAFRWTYFRTHDRDDQVLPGDNWPRDMYASDVYQYATRKDRHSSCGASSLYSIIVQQPTRSLGLGC